MKEAQDQGGWSEGGWAQFKDPEFLLGFKDTARGTSLRTPTWPLGTKMSRPKRSQRAKSSLLPPVAGSSFVPITIFGEPLKMSFFPDKISFLSLFLQDLLLGHVLILSGVPHLPAGTAVTLPELGWPSPWAQVMSCLLLMPRGVGVKTGANTYGQAACCPGWIWPCP